MCSLDSSCRWRSQITLNITALAPWMIIQTSDFRLTGSKEENAAQKQFVLAYFEWSGLLCYTGLAKWRAHETEKWLTDLLTHEPGEKRKPHRVATLVAEEG